MSFFNKETEDRGYLSDSDSDDVMSFYETDVDDLNEEDILSLDSDKSVGTEHLDSEDEREIILDYIKDLIYDIASGEITTIEEIVDNNILDNEEINTIKYFQEQSDDFKINTLKVIFAKVILYQFNETINIANIKNMSITLNPCMIEVYGLNEEETKIIDNFFMHYLETK